MQDDKGRTTTSYFVAYCIMILIGLYLVASTIASFLPVPHHTFTIIFTVSCGIPALAFFFNKTYVNRKTIALKYTLQRLTGNVKKTEKEKMVEV
jgi:hypothetical protein